MTLAIGMIAQDKEDRSVLLTSDTLVSWGELRFRERKIYEISDYPVLVAGSGVVGLIKEAVNVIEQVLHEQIGNNFSIPRLRDTMPKVSNYAYQVMKYFADRKDNELSSNLFFSLIIAASDEGGDILLYRIDPFGIPERCDNNPGYALIGSGAASGGILALSEYFPSDSVPNIDEATELAAYIISLVSSVDSTVGAYPDIRILSRGKTGTLSLEQYKKLQQTIFSRRDLFQTVWELASHNEVFDEFLLTFLNDELIKKEYRKFLQSRENK